MNWSERGFENERWTGREAWKGRALDASRPTRSRAPSLSSAGPVGQGNAKRHRGHTRRWVQQPPRRGAGTRRRVEAAGKGRAGEAAGRRAGQGADGRRGGGAAAGAASGSGKAAARQGGRRELFAGWLRGSRSSRAPLGVARRGWKAAGRLRVEPVHAGSPRMVRLRTGVQARGWAAPPPLLASQPLPGRPLKSPGVPSRSANLEPPQMLRPPCGRRGGSSDCGG